MGSFVPFSSIRITLYSITFSQDWINWTTGLVKFDNATCKYRNCQRNRVCWNDEEKRKFLSGITQKVVLFSPLVGINWSTGDYSRFEIQQCNVPQMREALGWETLECRRRLAAATTFYQSINNLIYLLAQVQNTPISSDTSPPTPMPTSTPSSPVQSLYGTISAYYSHPSLLTVLKPSKYMPCLSLEPSATLIDPWNLLFNITFIFVFSSIFWIIICAYISQL